MKYMFVVAHPDDEVLGAGAFIHKAVSDGEQVCVLILNADYEKSREGMSDDIEKSHAELGSITRRLFHYRNMEFYHEDHRDIVEKIEAEIESFEPDIIFTHFDRDIHNDHRITSICTQQAARIWQRHMRGYKVRALYFMEVQSSTDWSDSAFHPDTFVQVEIEDITAKIRALEVYKNVLRPLPHPRNEESITALATLRGTQIGYRYAEAFKTVWRDNM